MTRMVNCVKLGKELPAMTYKYWDTELGQKIFDNISQEAWRLWVEHSKMLVNEYRLDLTSAKAQQLLMDEADKFFFGEGAQLPPDYKAPAAK
jgi:Fe-S cluster biosynthesis and repair protein YggX